MKEQFRPVQSELTAQSNPSTLNVRGNIFMPEPGSGEIPPQKQQEAKPVAPKTEQGQPEKSASQTEGQKIPIEQRDTDSISPSDAFQNLDPASYPGLESLIIELKIIGQEGFADAQYLDDLAKRIGQEVGEGRVDLKVAEPALAVIRNFKTQAETAERQEELARRGYRDYTKEELMEEIGRAPAVEASHFPESLLAAAMQFRETREMLINRILFKPFEDETETNSYDINLYAQSNLDTLLGYLSREEREQYDYYISLRTAAQLFHTMNATIIGGNLDEFIKVAERINYQHFVLMQKIPGVSEVMRLYEQKYQDYLARYGRITTEGYRQLKKEVEKSFLSLNSAGLVRSEFETDRDVADSWKMEDWEIRRALNVGRTFFNLTFRAAEQIASGKISRREIRDSSGRIIQEASDPEQQWSSFPQESAVRIMNWMQYMLQRFEIATPRGGLEFLNMVKENYFKFLKAKRRKLGINRIRELGGMNVRELEVGAMFGVSGVYSSWRIENMAFPKIEVVINGQRTNIRQWLRDNQSAIKAARNSGNQNEVLRVLSPLIENMNVALGVLLKQEIVSGEVGYKARQRIWERVAEINLPLMIDYLSRIQYEGEATSRNYIDYIKQHDASNWDEIVREDTLPDGSTVGVTKWDILKEKILLNHEWKIKQSSGVDLKDAPEVQFDNDEQRLIQSIQQEGRNLALHLADIVFPYVPFMNDVPFELLDYGKPGEEFYKRRSGGDLPSYNKAEGAFIALMNNPGGLGHEEALKQFDAIIKGIESPQGTRDAQERVYPMFESWIDFTVTKPWLRQIVIKELMHAARKPTSLAQDYAGMEAESMDEFQTRKLIDIAQQIGIINSELARDLRKKKNLVFVGLLWAILRDFFWVPIVSGIWEFGKKVQSEKG